MTARVPAKVNLQLSVGPRRPDGYHELVTVFHALSLFDEVTASDGTPCAGITLSVDPATHSGPPLDESNLAWQAAAALAQYADVTADVHLRLRKSIPMSGGMAGGSADAAATLVACDALWQTGLGREELDVLAARLGSDVTFALHGGTAIGTGRGERLTPALISGQFNWVCAFSREGLSTPAVYAELDRLRGRKPVAVPSASRGLMRALRRGDAAAVGRLLHNDLQVAAISLRPRLELLLAAGREEGALGGMVSGSGPTCVFLARDASHAVRLAAALAGCGYCDGVAHAAGPAPGARIIESSHVEGDGG